jgi:nucleoside-diphosphate-sugar epimerase
MQSVQVSIIRVLVTGSSGHLGEALARTHTDKGDDVVGIDIKDGAFTTTLASITDKEKVMHAISGIEVVYHTATLHKPHIATHSNQQFVDTNVSGTLNLLEAAARSNVRAFIFTSTTSTFGDALRPVVGTAAAWITEQVIPQPKNIYGATKVAAEDLCQLFHRNFGLNCIVLRTSRFFPEDDDNKAKREAYSADNAKASEFLFRRVELEDAVTAHLAAADKATTLGFGRYIVSATSPLLPEDLVDLNTTAPAVVGYRVPEYAGIYAQLGWKMFDRIDRVYDNTLARQELGWQPKYDFAHVLDRLAAGEPFTSELARVVGSKGYHKQVFAEGPYPV